MEDALFFLKKYAKDIVFALLILVCIALTCHSIFYKEDKEVVSNENILAKTENEDVKEPLTATTIHVDIKGAVANPGVYEVKDGTIVGDIITLAGGFLDDAYQDSINLSKRVSDEMVIYIYTTKQMEAKNTIEEEKKPVESTQNTCNTSSYDINECVEKTQSIITFAEDNSVNSTPDSGITNLVNINTATQSELETLTGIGEVKAKAIIEYRSSNGNFTSIEEIMNVSGIGDAVFAKIKDYITV